MAIRPRAGTGPGTGTVRPPAAPNDERAAREAARRAEAESMLRRMSAEDTPDLYTVDAIERLPPATGHASAADQAPDSGAPAPAQAAEAAQASSAQVRELPLDAVRLSPFQPKGRPSAEALREVSEGIALAGTLEALLEPAADEHFRQLRPEAKRLAELAYSIQRDGVRVPIEVREAEDGTAECLSGHRRLAAATLAGLTRVPTLNRGPLTAAQAAKTVLEGNLHRENFTPWQEAVVATAVYEQRRREHKACDVRTIGQLMGWSHGKAGLFLKIRRMLPPAVLERIGHGDAARADIALGAVESVAALARLAKLDDEDRRIDAAQRLLHLAAAPPAPAQAATRTFVYRPKRGGGFLLDVSAPAESLALEEAERLLELLTTSAGRVQARVTHLRGRA